MLQIAVQKEFMWVCFAENGCVEEVQRLACHVYTHCLQVLPALVRQWWKDLDRKSAAYVDK